MKKLLLHGLTTLLVTAAAFAAPGQPGAVTVGYLPSNNTTTGVKTIDATRFIGYSFLLSEAKTLSSIRWFVDSIDFGPGIPTSQIDIYSDVGGGGLAPLASVATSTTMTAAFNLDQVWHEHNGFSLSMFTGVKYWIVVRRNTGNGTFNIQVPVGQLTGAWTQESTESFFTFNESVNSGTSWGNDSGTGLFPFILKFSDGTTFGLPFARKVRALDGSSSDNPVYNNRERGTLFTTPANAKLVVKCLTFQVAKVGNPTGSIRYRMYAGTTLLGTTAQIHTSNLVTGGNVPLCFPTALELAPNTVHRAVVGESTQSNTSANRINVTFFQKVDPSAEGQALKPFGAATADTYYGGASWTETTTQFVPFLMTLEKGGEFATAAVAANYGGYW